MASYRLRTIARRHHLSRRRRSRRIRCPGRHHSRCRLRRSAAGMDASPACAPPLNGQLDEDAHLLVDLAPKPSRRPRPTRNRRSRDGYQRLQGTGYRRGGPGGRPWQWRSGGRARQGVTSLRGCGTPPVPRVPSRGQPRTAAAWRPRGR
jgi:hypothetical protein